MEHFEQVKKEIVVVNFQSLEKCISLLRLYLQACYNCNQSGHMSRECTEPKKDNQNNRNGFNSTGFRSNGNDGGNTFRNTRNQNNDDNRGDNGDSKPAFAGWRGGASNNNNSDDTGSRSAFGSGATRGSFNNSTGGFRGKDNECWKMMKNTVVIGGRGGGAGFGSNDRGE